MKPNHGKAKKTIINLTFDDKKELLKSYMPFLKNGGLFMYTSSEYEINDSVFIRLKLPGHDEQIPIVCQVTWLSPKSTKGLSGVGLHFTKSDEAAKGMIETMLADVLNSSTPTHTM